MLLARARPGAGEITSPPVVRVDLHVHSSASFDCSVEPGQVGERCRRLGLAPVFLTDHNTIEGAVQLRGLQRFAVVVGEEVMTRDGELVGLFLTEVVPQGLSAKEAAARIKAQGGLVYLEHPYDPYRRHLSEEGIEEVADMIDIVEVWNGRSDHQLNRRAVQLCDTLGAAPGAGSDAHTLGDIGLVYVEMDGFEGARDFLVKLRSGKITNRRSGLRLPRLRRP
jgi:predicted metal-dependent phosphoesterase TrpH